VNYIITQLKPFGVMIEATDKNISSDLLNISFLKEYFYNQQLVLMRGFTTFKSANEFSSYCEKWGEISLWPFGKVLELIQHENPRDHIFDNSYVPLHWDGMYRPQIPEYQIFHCVKAPLCGQGGKTTFSNTIMALKHASNEAKQLWSKVTGIYERNMEFYNSKTISPIITKHPFRDFSVIRFNEPHSEDRGHLVNIPRINFTGLEEIEIDGFINGLKEALYHPKNFYSHEWQTGDVVITDNFSLLHGREKFETASARHIQRVQVLSDPPYNNPGFELYQ
jgi:alpha-ketoglutarate-dependent taurine dioxygenase